MSTDSGAARVSQRDEDDRVEVRHLLASLKAALPSLEKLLDDCDSHWGYEDPLFRFYHRSLKVYALQQTTAAIVAALQVLAPAAQSMNESFLRIVGEGTGRRFDPDQQDRWFDETRPIVEAFLHARYFLAMAVRYGASLDAPPRMPPSGWAALLSLYGLR